MATAYKVLLTVHDTGVVKFKPQDEETAKKTSEMLQENHEKNDLFFNKAGFHNHITHQLLTLYGLGASTSIITKGYNRNNSNQRPAFAVNEENVKKMRVPKAFMELCGPNQKGNPDRGADFLSFFQRTISEKGVAAVLQEFLFRGDDRSEDLLARMYSGFLHPIIHLGFGLEFNQPAIVAEALAQGACHDAWIGPFFHRCEEAAKKQTPTNKSLPEIMGEIHNNKKLSTAAAWKDGNKIRDGILARAPDEAIALCSQYTVSPSQISEKTAEMIDNAIYYTAAAQHPPKQVKFDFYFMHCVNSSIFWTTFNSLPYLTDAEKARLLEWKGRLDLCMYASRRSPELYLDEIVNYSPKEGEDADWAAIWQRLFEFPDDGHAIKLGRAVKHGEEICKPFEGKEWMQVKGNMWGKIGNMVVDSVEDEGATWVRSAGFDEAWLEYKDRKISKVHI